MIRKQTKLWKTKSGKKIRICDMDDNHLLNSIKLLQRTAEITRMKKSLYYTLCPAPRSDAAMDCFERECNVVWESTFFDYLPNIYNNLVEDALRRGLEIPEQDTRIDLELKILNKLKK